jgi:hypothetical protein
MPMEMMHSDPGLLGTGGREFAILVPQHYVNALKQNPELGEYIEGYGNGLSLYSCLDIEKDGIDAIYQDFRNEFPIYLWQKD